MILTTRSKERLEEDDPIYKWIDYWEEEAWVGWLKTMSVEEYNRQ